MKIDWSKAPKWANAVISSKDGQEFYVSQFGGISARQRVGYCEVDNDHSADMIIPHDWSLVATRRAPWAGEGLPPVGVEAEAYFHADTNPDWLPFTLKYFSEEYVVFRGPIGECHMSRCAFDKYGFKFRPVRTLEQIEEDERGNTINEIIRLWKVPPVGSQYNAAYEMAAAVYDARFRKQVKP